MPKAEEIEDADLDAEENSDEEEEGAEGEEADGSKDSKDSEEEDGSEDDEDDDESDSDEDDAKPLTRGDLKKILAEQATARRERNRSAADRRNSGKGRDTKGERREPSDARIAKLEMAETKRQFGYENGLAPDEVDVVFRLTQRPTAKSLRDPVIKGALEGYRSAKRARDNTPGTRARPARGSAREEKNMTPVERQSRFVDRRREILASKRER